MKACILFFVVFSVVIALPSKKPNVQNKLIVYPGLDVDNAVVATWQNGYSSPWNVFFGNKPYVVGWVGQENAEYEYEDSDYDSAEENQAIATNIAVEVPHDEITEDRKKPKN